MQDCQYLEDHGVGRLISLDPLELFNGNLGGSESSASEIGFLEFCNGLLVEGRFKLLKNIGEL